MVIRLDNYLLPDGEYLYLLHVVTVCSFDLLSSGEYTDYHCQPSGEEMKLLSLLVVNCGCFASDL